VRTDLHTSMNMQAGAPPPPRMRAARRTADRISR
jgi:hypothetical protein